MKEWSAKSAIIRGAEAEKVQRWLPSAGFAPEGHVIKSEPIPTPSASSSAEPSISSGHNEPTVEALSADYAAAQPRKIVKESGEALSPTEEALVSVAALRLLPDELESIRQQAFKEGEAEGFQKGRQEGIEEGKGLMEATFPGRIEEAVALKIKEAQGPVLELLHTIQEEVPKLDSTIAQHILDLALVLAQQMTCNAIQFNKKFILDLLEEAIQALPREARGWLQIYVHPEDAAVLKEALRGHPNEEEQKIIADPEIQKGGCRLVSRMGELDATLEARWETLLKNLGRDDAWLTLSGK